MFKLITILGELPTTALIALSTISRALTFYPNINLTDTSGNLIQAHGGAIIQPKNTLSPAGLKFYWFGQNNSGGGFQGVSCYKSSDLSGWEYLGLASKPTANSAISTDTVVERPKVFYNAKNDEYLDDSDYGLAQVGVAKSSTIEGPYEFISGISPLGHQSRDMTVWQDPDTDEGYLIFATNSNANLAIETLDDDYLNTTSVVSNFTSVYWEAPGVVKDNGTFYLLVSPQDGWMPTANVWKSASSMSGPWSDPAELAPSDACTYLSQNTYEITIVGSEATTYIYLGDRWDGHDLSSSTYTFMPLILNSTGLSIHNTGGWTLDPQTGKWSDLNYTSVTSSGSGAFGFTWNGTSGDKVLQVQYTYTGSKSAFANLGVGVNGDAGEGNVILESGVKDYTQQAPFQVSLQTREKVQFDLLNGDSSQIDIQGVNGFEFEGDSSVTVP